jgi:spore germination cell wall hydrolase CwlJ-like protein
LSEGAGRAAGLTTIAGSLSDAGLARYAADMDPAMLALARRHDPRPHQDYWGRVRGWEKLDLHRIPRLGDRDPDFDEARIINGFKAASPLAVEPSRPFVLTGAPSVRDQALHCLTQAVYFEAGFEPIEGQQAVAQTVINRVRHPGYPKSICGVIYEGAARGTGCQFSFTCDGSLAAGDQPGGLDQRRDRRPPGPGRLRDEGRRRRHPLPRQLRLSVLGADPGQAAHRGHAHLLSLDRTVGHAGGVPGPLFGRRDAVGRHPDGRRSAHAGGRPARARWPPCGGGREPGSRGSGEPAKIVSPEGVVEILPPMTGDPAAAMRGGRRLPTPEEIDKINKALGVLEAPPVDTTVKTVEAAPPPPPPTAQARPPSLRNPLN